MSPTSRCLRLLLVISLFLFHEISLLICLFYSFFLFLSFFVGPHSCSTRISRDFASFRKKIMKKRWMGCAWIGRVKAHKMRPRRSSPDDASFSFLRLEKRLKLTEIARAIIRSNDAPNFKFKNGLEIIDFLRKRLFEETFWLVAFSRSVLKSEFWFTFCNLRKIN